MDWSKILVMVVIPIISWCIILKVFLCVLMIMILKSIVLFIRQIFLVKNVKMDIWSKTMYVLLVLKIVHNYNKMLVLNVIPTILYLVIKQILSVYLMIN